MRVRIPRSALPPALCVGFAVILAFAMPLGATPERPAGPSAAGPGLGLPGGGPARGAEGGVGPPAAADQSSARAAFEAACGSFNPFFAVSTFAFADSERPPSGDQPAILAFSATDSGTTPQRFTLARQDQVGAVYGLAYDAARGTLYAAAYHKRSTALGPGGAGQVYAIDLATGTVRPFVSLYTGPDRHDHRRNLDEDAAAWVGWTGLADIEISADGSTLFVVNLTDGQIHRFALPSGAPLGAFRHGAWNEPWARNARPFGLGFAEGWLYHGVVNTLRFSELPGTLSGHVYRSRPDGSQMESLTDFAFDYPRGMRWQRWDDLPTRGSLGGFVQAGAQPILADIELAPGGELVLGLRDRVVDTLPSLARQFVGNGFPGVGDLLLAREGNGAWSVITSPEHFADAGAYEESSFGALARLPGFDLVASPARAPFPASPNEVGAFWNWGGGGSIARRETLQRIADNSDGGGSTGLGDIEVLCALDGPVDPAAPPTATAVAVTATAAAQATGTAIAGIPTLAPTGTPEHFEQHIADACRGDNPYLATVCYAGTNLTQFTYYDSASLVVFRDTPVDAPIYGVAPASRVGALWGLAYAGGSGTLYGAAVNRRLVWFGPAGPGAIYRLQIADGQIDTFAVVPDAGPDFHGPATGGDDRAADMVGKSSLGDIDLSTDERELFALNLYLRRIYRFDAATGALLGSFDHGAVAEPWAEEARPFALKFHRGRLYHGLVNSAQASRRPQDLWAEVYSSLPDGSDMRRELRVPLDYPRGTVPVPGVVQFPGIQDIPLDWQPWRDGYNDISAGRAQMSLYPQPVLADIEFAANGDMILGLKDRHNDMSLAVQRIGGGGQIDKPGLGLGDILRVPFDGRGWPGPAILDRYGSPADTEADRHAAGGLGMIAGFDILVANRLRVNTNNLVTTLLAVTPGVLWYDDSGNALRQEQACNVPIYYTPPNQPLAGRRSAGSAQAPAAPARVPPAWRSSPSPARRIPSAPQHSEWVPGKGVGDLEVLCGPTPTPTATVPLPSPTPSPSPTASPTRTGTPSPTPSPSATPTRGPIYLPVLPYDHCDPKLRPVDVVLVIDASTTMLQPTRAGRPKIDAAREAARRFLNRMQLPGDQAAVVAFNAEATVLSDLTGDRAALDRALEAIRNQEFTRIHRGLESAHALLTGSRRVAEHLPVVILLTDGRSNPDPVSMPLAAAEALKADGILLFTVGLGEDVEHEALRRMASRPEDYHWAPDGEDLGAIYEAIAGVIPCPRSAYWPFLP